MDQVEQEVTPSPKHELCQMDKRGDIKTLWDPENADEVAAAKETFNNLKAKGFWAYRVEGKDGAKGEVVQEFDPQAGRLIMAPRLVGG